jgi:hypothetical protein
MTSPVGVARIDRQQLRPHPGLFLRRQRARKILSARASNLRLDLGVRGEVQVPLIERGSVASCAQG